MLAASHRQTAPSHELPAASWDGLKGTAPELKAAVEAAAALQLQPSDVAELSLSDLQQLLPDVQPIHRLRLRHLAWKRPVDNHPTAGTKILPPPGLHRTAWFFGKILTQDPSDLGNARLALWFEVTLVMATLLFSISLSVSLSPARECANPADVERCAVLLIADQAVWMSISLFLLLGAAMMWANHFVVVLLSTEEVRYFVSNHLRLTAWGVLITITGIFLFFPGIALRIWILSSTDTAQLLVVTLATLFLSLFGMFNVVILPAVTGCRYRDVLAVWFGNFGLLPGSNQLRAVAGGT
jgi:hypothetical protein